MYYYKRILLAATALMLVCLCQAQRVVKGNVVNAQGAAVEYVSLGLEADSVGTISDMDGHFELEIPADRRRDLLVSHVSYQMERIPYDVYGQREGELTVVLKDKVVELTEVVIGKDNMLKAIVGRGAVIPASVVGMKGKGRPESKEWGFVFQSSRDYVINDISLMVSSSEFLKCTLSMNLYEERGGQYMNILNKPLYQSVYKSDGRRTLDFVPEEEILLKRRRHYFVSISCVDTYGETGTIYFPIRWRSSYFREVPDGTKDKLPVSPVIVVNGYEVKG